MAKVYLVTSNLEEDLKDTENQVLPAAFTDEKQANELANFLERKFDTDVYVDAINFNPENW